MLEFLTDTFASFIALVVVFVIVALIMAIPALVVTLFIEWLPSHPMDRIGTWILCDVIMTGVSMLVAFINKE